MYPKEKLIYNNHDAMKNTTDKEVKRIGFFPIAISDFFEGVEVLVVEGRKSGEYIYGLYSAGEYCGHMYFGNRWNYQDLAKICTDLMPPRLSQLSEYHIKNADKVKTYGTLELCHYAWIYQRVIEKVKKENHEQKKFQRNICQTY